MKKSPSPRLGWVLTALLGVALWRGVSTAEPHVAPVTGAFEAPSSIAPFGARPLRKQEGAATRQAVNTSLNGHVTSYFVAGALLLALQTALIAALLIQRARHRKTEIALRESEERFELVADNAPVLMWRAGTDKRCDFVSRPWLEFTGRTIEQELGNGWTEGIHPEDLDASLRTYASAFDARQPFRMEYRLRRADGVYRWIMDSGAPWYEPDGRFAGYIGSGIDITDHRDTEAALIESQMRYKLATAAVGGGVWDWNLETNDFYVDPELKRILGFADAEIPNRLDAWQSRVHPADVAATRTCAQAYLDGEIEIYEREHRMLAKDGSVRWLLSRGSLMRSETGTPVRMVGTDIDVTERKRSTEQFRFAMEAVPTGMIMVDRAGRITLVNNRIEKLFGYRRDELIGRPVELLIPERFRAGHTDDRSVFQTAPNARQMGAGLGLFGLRKDGTEVPIEIGLSPLRMTEGDFVLGSVADITQRKAADFEREQLMGQLQDLAGRLIEAQETERARVARDLHDDVSQQLAALHIALSALKRRAGALARPQDLQNDVSSLQHRTLALADNIRHLSHELHPEALIHSGLVAALTAYCAELDRNQTVTLMFHADGDLESVSRGAALCLYRVAQEALRNVIRHADASRANVTLRRVGDRVELSVTDDGKGFDVSTVRQRGRGMGLVSIRERVRLAAGTVTIVTELDKGTRMCVEVPADLEVTTGSASTSGPPAIPA